METSEFIQLHSRVFNVIKAWIGQHLDDYQTNRKLVERTLKFLRQKVSVDFNEISAQLVQTLGRRVCAVSM